MEVGLIHEIVVGLDDHMREHIGLLRGKHVLEAVANLGNRCHGTLAAAVSLPAGGIMYTRRSAVNLGDV